MAAFRSTGGTVTATPAIPSFSSQSIFAPATPPASGLPFSGVVRNGACKECTVFVGSGGLVRAKVPSGAGKRTAYALLDLGNRAASGRVLFHDVIGFGRGETPVRQVRLLQVLDPAHRVIFELVAGSDRRLYLTSPAGGLRANSLVLATGAIVPNDGVSGVAVDIVLKSNGWLLVSVNGIRTARVRSLAGARTGAPRFLAAGVIGYQAPRSAGALTATHAQVSVTTSTAPPTAAAQPAGQQTPAAQPVNNSPPPLTSLSPPTISGNDVIGDTLTAAPGTWSDDSANFSYVWERCDLKGNCTAIDGAESKTYDLVPADRGALVRVRVTAHVGGSDVSRASAPVGPVVPAAPTSLEAPTISGDAVVGDQLTADPGSWSDPDATITFAWQRCDGLGVCRTIDGATDATYDVTADDLDTTLLVEVTASNKGGATKVDSVPTEVVVPAAPSIVAAPAISGDTVVGSTLTVDPGSWSDPAATFTYAWLRCDGNGACTAIDGANDKTYVLTGDDVGFHIEVQVTAANAGGTGTAYSNSLGPVLPQPPSVVTAPSLSGDTVVGSTLTVDPGTWSDPAATFTYAWLRCDGNGACTAIDGANDKTYVLTGDDVGFHIEVQVTAANAGGTGTAYSNSLGPVLPQPPSVVAAPSLSGDTVVGSTLTVDPGTWSDPQATFGYAWLRCDESGDGCTKIDGANDTTYVLTGNDIGFHIEVRVTAANAGGARCADSNLLGPVALPPPPPPPVTTLPTVVTPPSVSGDPIVGSTLYADPGSWSDPAATFGYAWLRCDGDGDGDGDDSCTTIDSADSTTYVLTPDDVGFRMEVSVTADNAAGTGTAQSTPTDAVQAACTPGNSPSSSP